VGTPGDHSDDENVAL